SAALWCESFGIVFPILDVPRILKRFHFSGCLIMNTYAAATSCSSGVKSEQTVHEIKPNNMTVNGAYRWEKSQSGPSLLPRVRQTRETAAQKQATNSAADRQARTLALLAAFLSVSEIPFGT